MDLKIFFIIFSITNGNWAQINTPSDYFKACLNLKHSWNKFHTDLAQEPIHPLTSDIQIDIRNGLPLDKPPCRSYQCLRRNEDLNLDKLRSFQCYEDIDCAPDISNMICTNHSISNNQGVRYCSCPLGYAYSTVECRCQKAELCWSSQDTCHKGMKCQDQKCSCKNLDQLLYETHGGFCVESRTTHLSLNHLTSALDSEENSSNSGPEIVVVALLAAFVILGLIAMGLYALSVKKQDIDFCASGDYVCDNDTIAPGNRQNQPHVAAWDAPGMDFLSEEQTLKYLNRSNSIEVTKSPSMATTAELVDEAPSPSGSLPECEQQNGREIQIHRQAVGRLHQITVETNFENPTYNSGNSRHSSESTATKEEEEDEDLTKSTNIL